MNAIVHVGSHVAADDTLQRAPNRQLMPRLTARYCRALAAHQDDVVIDGS